MYHYSNKGVSRVISILTIATFLLTNTVYGAPTSRSFFKNKKVDYKKLSTQREDQLDRKKSVLQGEDTAQKEEHKRHAQKVLSGHLKDLTQIHIPSELGKVIEVYQAPSSNKKGLVVHIQDLHTNPEAQLNLAGILEILLKDYELGLVCSEGADGVVDTSSISSFPDYEVREKTARIFIDSGELTGEEYLSITKYPELPIWGIEDRGIYFKNIIDFNKIMKFSPESQVFISQARKALDQIKTMIYTRELKAIDQKELDYENEKIETDEYLTHLNSYIQKFNIPTENYRNITLLTEATQEEKAINQEKVMQESQNLLLNLQEALSSGNNRTEIDSLMVKIQLFKEQKISPFSFYSYLKDLALRHIPDKIANYPNLNDFIAYLAKVNSLDTTKLFVEMEDLAYEIKTSISKTDEQKTIIKALRNIKFLEGFFNLKVSNEELDYYLANKDSHRVPFFKAFLGPALKKYQISAFIDYNPDLIDYHLNELEDFYKTVKARDVAMVRNATSEIERRKVKVAALVSGGFHTKGIKKLLRAKGYSYIVISPYSSTDIDEENYRYLLSGRRKPIEELLQQIDLREAIDRFSAGLRVVLGSDTDLTKAYNNEVAPVIARALDLPAKDAMLREFMPRIETALSLSAEYKKRSQDYLNGDIDIPTMKIDRMLRLSDLKSRPHIDLTSIKEEDRAYLLQEAVNYFKRLRERNGKITVSVMAAGAASRMKKSDYLPSILAQAQKEAADRFGETGNENLPAAKALLPAAKVDSRWMTFLDIDLINIQRMNDEFESLGLGRPFTAKILSNELYQDDIVQEIERGRRDGIHNISPQDILFFYQRFGYGTAATPEDVTKNRNAFSSEDEYKNALEFAKNNRGRVLTELGGTQESNGEYWHAHFETRLDQTTPLYTQQVHNNIEYDAFRSIDNMAIIDENWLVIFGNVILNDLTVSMEVSKRPKGSAGKGGGFAISYGYPAQIEDDVAQASIKKLGFDIDADEKINNPNRDNHTPINNATGIIKFPNAIDMAYGITGGISDIDNNEHMFRIGQEGRLNFRMVPTFRVVKGPDGDNIGTILFETRSWDIWQGNQESFGIAWVASTVDVDEGLITDKSTVRFDPLKTKENYDDKSLQTVRQAIAEHVVKGKLLSDSFRKIAKARKSAFDKNAQWDKWSALPVTMDDLNLDMFRDYDYRSTGPVLKPEMVFRFGLAWADMALKKAAAAGIKNRKVLISRDARKIEPELVEALAAALRYMGLDVIYIAADGPNAVSSYSWGVQDHRPLMSIFLTASHVSRPKDVIVRGFKVAMLDKKGGTLQSMTTKEIKHVSKDRVIDLIEHPEKIKAMENIEKGKFIPSNIDENCIRMCSLVARVADQEGSLYELAREIESSESPSSVLDKRERQIGRSTPLKGLKVVVEGVHTPSGKLAAETFKELGAKVVLINGDIREIEGEHTADPSKAKNLDQLKKRMQREKADFGIAFDLDGDRGAIVVPRTPKTEPITTYKTLAPDNLICALLPYMVEKNGYNQRLIGKKVGVIRDVLGTFGVNNIADKLGIEPFQTDAGYVFLKALRRELLEDNYAIPIYGERSGHCWLDPTGEFENPIAVTALFAVMVKKLKYKNDKTDSENPFWEAYHENTVSYMQSPRFQPLFHQTFLSQLSSDPRNDTGWKYDPANPTKPPQAIIALGKDAGVKRLQAEFSAGKTYNTPAGKLKVREFNAYQDPPDEGGLYRFADIVFERDGKFVGRFVFRASSNDPTFVCSFETPSRMEGEKEGKDLLAWYEDSQNRYVSIGGVVLDWLEKNEIALVTGAEYPNSEPIEMAVLEYRQTRAAERLPTKGEELLTSLSEIDINRQKIKATLAEKDRLIFLGRLRYILKQDELTEPQTLEMRYLIGNAAIEDIDNIDSKLSYVKNKMHFGLDYKNLQMDYMEEFQNELSIAGNELDNILFFIETSKYVPERLSPLSAGKEAYIWHEMGNKIIPFEFGGRKGIKIDSALFELIEKGEAGIHQISSPSGTRFLRYDITVRDKNGLLKAPGIIPDTVTKNSSRAQTNESKPGSVLEALAALADLLNIEEMYDGGYARYVKSKYAYLLQNFDITMEEYRDYVEKGLMSMETFVKVRTTTSGVSKRTAQREIRDLRLLGIITPRQTKEGKYRFRAKLTRKQILSLPGEVKALLGSGSIAEKGIKKEDLAEERCRIIQAALGLPESEARVANIYTYFKDLSTELNVPKDIDMGLVDDGTIGLKFKDVNGKEKTATIHLMYWHRSSSEADRNSFAMRLYVDNNLVYGTRDNFIDLDTMTDKELFKWVKDEMEVISKKFYERFDLRTLGVTNEMKKSLAMLVKEGMRVQMDSLYGKSFEEAGGLSIDAQKMARVGFETTKDGRKINRLGWTIENLKWLLDNPGKIEDVIDDAAWIRNNYRYVIFCGMGGSGLSVQTVKTTFGEPEKINIYSLRTTDPAVIKDILDNITKDAGSLNKALAQTLIIPISKSGTTKETVSHKEYFEALFAKKGLDIKDHMWVITDDGFPMDTGDYKQREIQLNGKGDIGGRFTSPTTHIFLLPAALVAPEKVNAILDKARLMNIVGNINEDTFINMGVYLYNMASRLGKDKLTFMVPEEIKDLPMWSEQLIEESLGKDGKGISVFYGEDLSTVSLKDIEANDRIFLRINVAGKKTNDILWQYLEKNSYPVFEIDIDNIYSIGGLMLGFQRAVATIGYLWDICFVDQPAVEGYKNATREVIAGLKSGEKVQVPGDWQKVSFGKLNLYYDRLIKAGALTKEEIESEVQRLGAAMDDAPAVYTAIIKILRQRPGFEAKEIASYGRMTDGMRTILQKARKAIFTDGLKIPSKLGEGPDKNHSYQQNIEAGKDMWFSTYFMPLEIEQPNVLEYDENLIRAQTIGTVNSIVKGGRKVALITFDSTIKDAEKDLSDFFEKVSSYLRPGVRLLGAAAQGFSGKTGTVFANPKGDIKTIYKTEKDRMEHVYVYLAHDVLENKAAFGEIYSRLSNDNRIVIIAKDSKERQEIEKAGFTDDVVDILIAGEGLLKGYTLNGINAQMSMAAYRMAESLITDSGIALKDPDFFNIEDFKHRLDKIDLIDGKLAGQILKAV